jgi:hypothetical protein
MCWGLDAWIAEQPHRPVRLEAIRRLVSAALGLTRPKRSAPPKEPHFEPSPEQIEAIVRIDCQLSTKPFYHMKGWAFLMLKQDDQAIECVQSCPLYIQRHELAELIPMPASGQRSLSSATQHVTKPLANFPAHIEFSGGQCCDFVRRGR